MIRALMILVSVMMGGCASDKAVQYVYVAPDIARSVPPSECTAGDPAFPRLPNGDVDAVAAVKDRIAIRRRDIEIARRRAVCRRWLDEQFAPADAPTATTPKRVSSARTPRAAAMT